MKAVIFDLFETLVTEWGRPKYTIREMASDLDIDCQTFRDEWEALHDIRYIGKLCGTVQVFKAILRNLRISRDEKLLVEISRRRDECKKGCFEKIEPEIIDMLSALKRRNYKIGLISNCSTEEIEGLQDSELYQYFDAVSLSCNVGFVKPDTRIYEHCLSALNEQASHCFFIGDGGSNELNGARRAGMIPLKALWFIKYFAKDFDIDKTYPAFSEPSELTNYIFSIR